MTLSTDLIAIGSVKVGTGPQYPVVRQRLQTAVEGPGGQNGGAYRVERWELTCHAWAADNDSIATASETIRANLCTRGEVVTLTEWAGTPRVLAAGGAVGGGLPGYPVVTLADEPERCFGTMLTFTLSVESRIPQPVSGVVEHDWERTEETDEEGDVAITQRGTYRVTNGSDAQAAAQAAVIDDEEADAAANDRTFRLRWTLGPDASVARYEFTAADKSFTASGVTEAQLTDRTARDNNGRVVRTISGYAVGTGAQAWIDAQAPTPDATNILVRKETSPASLPDGRVTFLWEVLTGVADPQFPGITIFGFSERFDEAEQVEVLTAATYLGRDPVLRYAGKAPCVYSQVTRVDFLGDWADGIAAVTGLGDDDNLITTPRRVLSAGPHGLKTLDFSASYMYATPLTPKPDPRAIPAIA